MSNLRTNDVDYGADYWNTLDNGDGYQDSVMWQDIAHIVKELFGYAPDNTDLGGLKILDYGCAMGFLVKHLRARGMDAWGVDFSEWALENAPDDCKDYIRWGDLRTGNPTFWGNGYFDVFTCFETMEHIEKGYVPNALHTMYDSLKPGGYGLLSICTEDQPGWDTDPTHVTIEFRDWWVDRFRRAGFSVLDDGQMNFLMTFHLFHDHHGILIVSK